MSLSISPTLVWTSKFFVGFILRQSSGTFPGALDQTPPTFLNRSLLQQIRQVRVISSTLLLTPSFPLTTIEGAGISGNWLIEHTRSGRESSIAISPWLSNFVGNLCPSAFSRNTGGPSLLKFRSPLSLELSLVSRAGSCLFRWDEKGDATR